MQPLPLPWRTTDLFFRDQWCGVHLLTNEASLAIEPRKRLHGHSYIKYRNSNGLVPWHGQSVVEAASVEALIV